MFILVIPDKLFDRHRMFVHKIVQTLESEHQCCARLAFDCNTYQPQSSCAKTVISHLHSLDLTAFCRCRVAVRVIVLLLKTIRELIGHLKVSRLLISLLNVTSLATHDCNIRSVSRFLGRFEAASAE